MAVTGTPRMVTDGLVLYLDAANVKSYPGSGTVWTDLSPSVSSGSLTNGPTFTSISNGSFVFDGTDDYANFYAPNLGSTTTVEMWANVPSFTSPANNFKMFFGWYLYSVLYWDGNFGFNTGNGDVYGLSAAAVSSLGLANNWKHYVFEMRTDVSYTNNKLYINSVLQGGLALRRNSEDISSKTFNSGSGRISGWLYSTPGYHIAMSCSIFKVYNRSLTQSEITQNYEATRERFGL